MNQKLLHARIPIFDTRASETNIFRGLLTIFIFVGVFIYGFFALIPNFEIKIIITLKTDLFGFWILTSWLSLGGDVSAQIGYLLRADASTKIC